MELRLLETDAERNIYRAGMLEARATKGGKFRETARSRVSEIQMTFARLYGVFDEADPDRLLGGFSIHCLNEFSQSFPIPNLTHLPPNGIYEAGQLWALSHEAALALRKGSMILLGLLQAQALLIYPLIIPRDISQFYKGFQTGGPAIRVAFRGDRNRRQSIYASDVAGRRRIAPPSGAGIARRFRNAPRPRAVEVFRPIDWNERTP
jgi:hypothetical protein